MCCAAASVMLIAIVDSLLVAKCLDQAFLLLVVANSCLDGIFSEYGAVDFHWRQRQFFCQLGVADGDSLIQGLAFHPFGRQGAGGDGRTAAVSLEFGDRK